MSNQAVQETPRLAGRIFLFLGLRDLLLEALLCLLVEFIVLVEIGWINISTLLLVLKHGQEAAIRFLSWTDSLRRSFSLRFVTFCMLFQSGDIYASSAARCGRV